MIKKEKLIGPSISPIAYTGQNKNQYGLSGFIKNPTRITKTWGYELIYQNHNLYCCKVLHIEKNNSCSYHLHMEKHETLLVIKGTLTINTTYNKQHETYHVKEGEAFVVAPGFIHSLKAESESVTIVETSTSSYDTDSIRIKEGK